MKRANNMSGKMSENHTQIHHARSGIITRQMRHVAQREKLEPELVRDEVARGRMVIPANVNHLNLEPMCIGVAGTCKINAMIVNSAMTSNIEDELKKFL
jgi:phosphomethylpyrimidine synthase